MDMNKIILAGVAAIAVAGLAASADATTIHFGGSSASREFVNEVPLAICAAGGATDTTHYKTIDNNKHLWTCTTTAVVPFTADEQPPVVKNLPAGVQVFNYSARGSADGVSPLAQPTGSAGAKGAVGSPVRPVLPFIDAVNPQGATTGNCPAPSTTATLFTVKTAAGATVNNFPVFESLSCPNAGPFSATGYELNMGVSDVRHSSFGQTSPGNGEPVDPAAGALRTNALLVLPFNIAVANNVHKLDSVGGDAGQLTNLSRKHVEGLFSGVITDWREIGAGITVNANGTGGIDPAAFAVRLCMRHAGSGSKAIFQKAMIKDGEEVTLGSPFAIFNVSSSDQRGCLNSAVVATRGRVGYIDVKESQATPPYVVPAVASQLTNAYAVSVDGYRPVDSSVAAVDRTTSQKTMYCGNAIFTTDLRSYRRLAGAYAADIELLTDAYVATSKDADVVAGLPASWAFGGLQEMLFTRTDDGGVHDHTFNLAGPGSNAKCNGL